MLEIKLGLIFEDIGIWQNGIVVEGAESQWSILQIRRYLLHYTVKCVHIWRHHYAMDTIRKDEGRKNGILSRGQLIGGRGDRITRRILNTMFTIRVTFRTATPKKTFDL